MQIYSLATYAPTNRECLLLQSFFARVYDEQRVHALFDELDVANSNFFFLLLLGNYLATHNWEYVDPSKRKWIEGILRQASVRNALAKKSLRLLVDECRGDVCLATDIAMRLIFDKPTVRGIKCPVVVSLGDAFDRLVPVVEKINSQANTELEKICLLQTPEPLGLRSARVENYETELGVLRSMPPEETLVCLLTYYNNRLKTASDDGFCFKMLYDGIHLLRMSDPAALEKCLVKSVNHSEIERDLDVIRRFMASQELRAGISSLRDSPSPNLDDD